MAENSPYRTSNNIFAHSGAPTEIIKLVDTVKAKYPQLFDRSIAISDLGKYPEIYSLVSKILEYGKQLPQNTAKVKSPDFNTYASAFYQEYPKSSNIFINKSGLPYIGSSLGNNFAGKSQTYASQITTGFGSWVGVGLGISVPGSVFSNFIIKDISRYLAQITSTSDPADDAKNLNEALRLYFNKAKGLYATNDEIETGVEAEFKNVINNVFMDKYNRQKNSEALTEKFFEAAKGYNLISDWLGITN